MLDTSLAIYFAFNIENITDALSIDSIDFFLWFYHYTFITPCHLDDGNLLSNFPFSIFPQQQFIIYELDYKTI